MPWRRLNSSLPILLINLENYECKLTDLESVWVESLDNDRIRSRLQSLESPIALDTQDDIDYVLEIISKSHEAVQTSQEGDLLRVDYSLDLDAFEFRWYFECKRIPSSESSTVIKTFILGVLESVQNINIMVEGLHSERFELIYHLKNLTRTCENEVTYEPHRFQKSYKNAISDATCVPDTQPSQNVREQNNQLPKWELGLEFVENFTQSQKSEESTPAQLSTSTSTDAVTNSLPDFQPQLAPTETEEEKRERLESQLMKKRKKRRF